MSTTVLGISAFYDDSAAALVRDGEIIAAAQEDAFRRVRHNRGSREKPLIIVLKRRSSSLPRGCRGFYDSPLLTLDRVLRNCLHAGSEAAARFEQAARSFLACKMFVEDYVLESRFAQWGGPVESLYRTPLCSRSIGVLSVTFQGCCCARFQWRR